ncbi:MAG TPA: aminopeptidase P family N-terminal domain-containing protein, partial [Mycobacterium sp.]|nr:aminopeptidase P family N-terminal domain-containing protein [Mycobacterium sp.]
MTHSQRRDNLKNQIGASGLDAMLVTDLNNVRYLSGFSGSNGALLVFADDRGAVLATDGRYRTQAAEQAADLEIAIERAVGRHLVGQAADADVSKLGFESNVVTVDGLDALTNEVSERYGKTELVRAAGTV